MKYQNIYKSEIGTGTKVSSFVEIANSKVGERCNIQAFVSIPNGTVIEDDVFIGPGVRILNDKYPPSDKIQPVLIKKGAVIGGGAIILPGVIVGKNAVIGAGAVVTKDVPDDETWVGVPAMLMTKAKEFHDLPTTYEGMIELHNKEVELHQKIIDDLEKEIEKTDDKELKNIYQSESQRNREHQDSHKKMVVKFNKLFCKKVGHKWGYQGVGVKVCDRCGKGIWG